VILKSNHVQISGEHRLFFRKYQPDSGGRMAEENYIK
jgi:hypothetical protein